MNSKQQTETYIMNTYARFDAQLVRGEGTRAWDANGKEYLDLGAGVGVNSLGYCNPGWVEAVCRQAGTLQHTSNLYYTEPGATVAAALCEDTPFEKVFFTNSGAEANECAIKLARKHSTDTHGEERNEIITLTDSFHGRTVTTLSATGQDGYHKHFFPFTGGFVIVAPGLEAVEQSITDKTCAILLECIQGEGGVNILDKDFVQGVERLCRAHDLLLLIDEVQTGIGRTGTLFAYEQYEIQPDIITLAKGLGGGLPIGACLCTKDLQDVLGPGSHGSTYGANPVACAGAAYVLKIVRTPEFLADVREKAAYLAEKLRALPGVAAVRQRGLMIGIVPEEVPAKEIAKKCIEYGLLVLTAKDVVRLLPPLTITRGEIDEALRRLHSALS